MKVIAFTRYILQLYKTGLNSARVDLLFDLAESSSQEFIPTTWEFLWLIVLQSENKLISLEC